MLSGMSEIPTHQFFVQLSFFENIADMLCYSGPALAEQLCHVGLRKPHGFGFQTDVEFYVTGRGLVDEELGVVPDTAHRFRKNIR